MIEQLEERRVSLNKEIEASSRKTAALEQSNMLLTNITSNAPQMITVMAKENNEILFCNKSAETGFAAYEHLKVNLFQMNENSCAKDDSNNYSEISLDCYDELKYFSVYRYSLEWANIKATAFLIDDITRQKCQLEELETYASYDEMTGLSNRRHGMAAMNRLLEEKKPFVLCFADLDNLKYVNDIFGHKSGDEYLLQAADSLKRFFPGEIISRIGGDEFMLLITGMSYGQCKIKMQELADHFTKSNVNKPYLSRISYGFVQAEENSNMSAGELLSLADERMYINKKKKKPDNKKLNTC
jgi:diguanylate cyclase (GGDEF)-like protein